MSFLSFSLARRSALALLLAAATPVAACGPPGMCDDVDPRQTEHFVITEARAAILVAAAADGGYGPTCHDECATIPHVAAADSTSSCSVDAPMDGGVGLTCVYGWLCR